MNIDTALAEMDAWVQHSNRARTLIAWATILAERGGMQDRLAFLEKEKTGPRDSILLAEYGDLKRGVGVIVCDCHTWPDVPQMHEYVVALEAERQGMQARLDVAVNNANEYVKAKIALAEAQERIEELTRG